MSSRIDANAGETDPRELAARIAALRQAQLALSASAAPADLAVLADAVERWLAPESPWFARALQLLPAATGFSPAMIRQALPTMLAPLRGDALAETIATEVGTRRGPALILHVLPGNLPGLAAIPAALSLAIGSSAVLKPGRGDRICRGSAQYLSPSATAGSAPASPRLTGAAARGVRGRRVGDRGPGGRVGR